MRVFEETSCEGRESGEVNLVGVLSLESSRVSGEELEVEDFASNIQALGAEYPSQTIPSLLHLWQIGFPSSHLT